jgi:carbon-monoxide dehydrogenase medium subunit
MIPAPFDYHRPADLAEALQLLTRHTPDAALLAGGHTLLPAMKLRHTSPGTLIDIDRIPELRGISVDGGAVRIGAMTTHGEIEHHGALRTAVPLLPAAARLVGDPLVRNRGTLGGSLVAADVGADWPAVVTALDATLELHGPTGQRRIPVDDFFVSGGRTAVRPDEILVAIIVPAFGVRTRGAYVRRTHPASGYAMVNAASVLSSDTNGVVTRWRIAIGGATPVPTRLTDVEDRLVGGPSTEEAVRAATAAVYALPATIGDDFGSADYRSALVPVYVRRALLDTIGAAWQAPARSGPLAE